MTFLPRVGNYTQQALADTWYSSGPTTGPASGGTIFTMYDTTYMSLGGVSSVSFQSTCGTGVMYGYATNFSTNTYNVVSPPLTNTCTSFRVYIHYGNGTIWTGGSSGVTFIYTAGAPIAPTSAQATVAATSPYNVNLSWSGAFANGSPITDYILHWSGPDGIWQGYSDGISTATSATLPGALFTPGNTYTFHIRAVNAYGQSSPAAASVAYATAPGQPLNPTIARAYGPDGVTVSWATPTSNGGNAITDYRVELSMNGGAWVVYNDGVSTNTSVFVPSASLTEGASYVVRVSAINSAGTGLSTQTGTGLVYVLTPNVPENLSLSQTPVSNGIVVSWQEPQYNTENPATDYKVEYSDNGTNWTVYNDGVSTATTTTIPLTSLAVNNTYSVRVSALNARGAGPTTLPAQWYLQTSPDAPTNVLATIGDDGVTIAWDAPAVDGGNAITDYVVRYSSDEANWQVMADGSGTATSVLLPGSSLVAGNTYVFVVAAVNEYGQGNTSAVSAGVTYDYLPGAPTIMNITPGNAEALLTYSAPTPNGGTPVTDYRIEYRISGMESWVAYPDSVSADTTMTVGNLTKGSEYEFRVSAINELGLGSPSASVSSAIPAEPSAPLRLIAAQNIDVLLSAVQLEWEAPVSDGGSAITDYVVQYIEQQAYDANPAGASWTSYSDGISSTPAAGVGALTPGIPYYFRVAARNIAGQGPYVSTVPGEGNLGTVGPISPPASLTVTDDLSGSPLMLSVVHSNNAHFSSKSHALTVTTNNSLGYTLMLSVQGASQRLSSGANSLRPFGGTALTPVRPTSTGWGYRIDNVGEFGGGTLEETNVSSSRYTWAGVPPMTTPELIKSTSSAVSGDTTRVWYGIYADSSVPDGTYSTQMLYTVVAN